MRFVLLAIAVIVWVLVTVMKKTSGSASAGGFERDARSVRRRGKPRAPKLARGLESRRRPPENPRSDSGAVRRLPPRRESPPRVIPRATAPVPESGPYVASTEELIDALRRGDVAVRKRATALLVTHGVEALPDLRHAVHDPDVDVRRHAEEALRQILAAAPLDVFPDTRIDSGDRSEQDAPAPADLPAEARVADGPPAIASPGQESPAEEEEPTGPVTASASADLADRLRTVAAASRFGAARKDLLKDLAGVQERFAIVVDRVSSSGMVDVSDAWREGRQISGVIKDTDVVVAVRLKPSENERVDALGKGQRTLVGARFATWDAIYDRAVFEGALAD